MGSVVIVVRRTRKKMNRNCKDNKGRVVEKWEKVDFRRRCGACVFPCVPWFVCVCVCVWNWGLISDEWTVFHWTPSLGGIIEEQRHETKTVKKDDRWTWKKKMNRKCKDNRGRVVGKCEEADFRGMVWFESRFEQKWKMLKVSSWNCSDTFSWYICHMALRWMLSMSMSRVLIVCRIWIKWLFCWKGFVRK